jgi:hypothetical protein
VIAVAGAASTSAGRRGLRTPARAIPPPSAISVAAINTPRWKADSDDATMSSPSADRLAGATP